MPLGEKTMYTSLWKIVFTQVVGADCTVTVVALLVVASTIFKAFLAASTINLQGLLSWSFALQIQLA